MFPMLISLLLMALVFLMGFFALPKMLATRGSPPGLRRHLLMFGRVSRGIILILAALLYVKTAAVDWYKLYRIRCATSGLSAGALPA